MLTGCGNDASNMGIKAKIDRDVQRVTTKVTSNGYEAITVQKGIPVEWTIHVPDGVLTGCNNKMIIENYGIQKDLSVGDNKIEFTPSKAGTVPYTCWMGMVSSEINVVEK